MRPSGKIVYWLKKAEGVAENPEQKAVIAKLIEFYETGDLKTLMIMPFCG